MWFVKHKTRENFGIPPPVQWFCGAHPQNTEKDGRETGSQEKTQVAQPHFIWCATLITRQEVRWQGYSPHFLMFRRRPHLPIDLLFPTVRHETVKGVYHYISTLYKHLRHTTILAWAVTNKEAQRFKKIYDWWAGEVALWPRQQGADRCGCLYRC